MTTPRRIAVGYDGSLGAEVALRWAAALAVAVQATLRVVHAVGLLEHAGLAPPSDHEERARRVVAEEGFETGRLEWCVLDGDPDSVLRRVAEGVGGSPPADLLVVGTRGAGAHPGTLLGSTSLGLAERAPVPVVVVPLPGP